jgi:hypothetical protein
VRREPRRRRSGRDRAADPVGLFPRGGLLLPGDLREYREWRLPERLRDLVERAARVSRSRSGSDPILVFDADGLGKSLDERAGMGPIRYGPPGHILSVR